MHTTIGRCDKIALVGLEDLSGQVEIMASDQILKNYTDYLKSDQVLTIEPRVSRDGYGSGDGLHIVINQVVTPQMARERCARNLGLTLTSGYGIECLAAIPTAHRLSDTSYIPLQLSYSNDRTSGRFQVSSRWMVTPDTDSFNELEALLDSKSVEVNQQPVENQGTV